jgi:hypothetical protein
MKVNRDGSGGTVAGGDHQAAIAQKHVYLTGLSAHSRFIRRPAQGVI